MRHSAVAGSFVAKRESGSSTGGSIHRWVLLCTLNLKQSSLLELRVTSEDQAETPPKLFVICRFNS
eukprot:4604394-Pleurochrysis_carterae.AAC.1